MLSLGGSCASRPLPRVHSAHDRKAGSRAQQGCRGHWPYLGKSYSPDRASSPAMDKLLAADPRHTEYTANDRRGSGSRMRVPINPTADGRFGSNFPVREQGREGPVSAQPRRWRRSRLRTGIHPFRPFAAIVAEGSFGSWAEKLFASIAYWSTPNSGHSSASLVESVEGVCITEGY